MNNSRLKKFLLVILTMFCALVTGLACAVFAGSQDVDAFAQTADGAEEADLTSDGTVSALADDSSAGTAIPEFWYNNTKIENGAVSLYYNKDSIQQVEVRNLVSDSLAYDDITIEYKLNTSATALLSGSWLNNVLTVNISAGTGVSAYYYSITLTLKAASITDGKTWGDGTTAAKVFNIQILPRKIETPTYKFVKVTTETDEEGVNREYEEEVAVDGNSYTVQYDYYKSYTFRLYNYNNSYLSYNITSGISAKYVTPETGNAYFEMTLAAHSNVGTYYLNATLINSTNVAWADGTASATKSFYMIVEPKELEVPKIIGADDETGKTKTMDWSGVTNTITFGPVTKYEIALYSATGMTSNDFNAADSTFSLYASKVGTYTITFKLYSTTNYVWKDGTTSTVSYTFIITPKVVDMPRFYYYDTDNTWQSENPQEVLYGSPLEVEFRTSNYYYALDGWDSTYMTWSNTVGYVNSLNNYYAVSGTVESGRYLSYINYYHASASTSPIDTWTVAVTPQANCVWNNEGKDNSTIVFALKIVKAKIAAPEILNADEGTTNAKTLTYNGLLQTVQIINVRTNIVLYQTRTNGSSYTTDSSSGTWTFSATNAGTYTLTLKLSTYANKYSVYEWADANIDQSDYRYFNLTINKKKISLPTMYYHGVDSSYNMETAEQKSTYEQGYIIETEFSGVSAYYYLSLDNYDSSEWTAKWTSKPGSTGTTYNSSVMGSQYRLWGRNYSTLSATYSPIGDWIFTLTPNANCVWNDGSTDGFSGDISCTLRVNKKTVAVPKITTLGASDDNHISFTYDGTVQTVSLSPYTGSVLSATREITKPQNATSATTVSSDGASLSWTADLAGEYMLSLQVAESNYYRWEDADSDSSVYRYYYISVNRATIGNLPYLKYYDKDSAFGGEEGSVGQTLSGSTFTFDYRTNNYYFTVENYNSSAMTATLSDTNFLSATPSGNSLQITLSNYTNAAIIGSFTVTIAPNANYQWGEALPNYDGKVFTINIRKAPIKEPTLVIDEADKEQYDGNSRRVKYTGNAYSLVYANADSANVVAETSLAMTQDWTAYAGGLTLYASDAGTYVVTLCVKEADFYQWENLSNPVYNLVIEKIGIEVPVFSQTVGEAVSSTQLDVTVEYNLLSKYQFKLTNINTDYVTYSVSSTSMTKTFSGTDLYLELAAKVSVGNYTVTITPNTNYTWNDNSGSGAMVFVVHVIKKTVKEISIFDTGDGGAIIGKTKTAVYTGQDLKIDFTPITQGEVSFAITGTSTTSGVTYAAATFPNKAVQYTTYTDADGNEISGAYISFIYNCDYTITINLASTSNFIWYDQTTAGKAFTFSITPQEHVLPVMTFNGQSSSSEDGSTTSYTFESQYDPNNAQSFTLTNPDGSDFSGFDISFGNTYAASYAYYMTYTLNAEKTVLTVTIAKGAPSIVAGCIYYVRLTPQTVTINSAKLLPNKWVDNTYTYKQFSLVLKPRQIDTPVYSFIETKTDENGEETQIATAIDDGAYSVTYSGSAYTITFSKIYNGQVSVATSKTVTTAAIISDSWVNDTRTFKMTNAGTYTFTCSLYNSACYIWKDGSTDARTFTFTIERKATSNPLYRYSVDGSTYYDVADGRTDYEVQYTGTPLYVSFDAEYAALSALASSSSSLTADTSSWNAALHLYKFSGTAVGNYTITVTLNSNYCWEGGQTGDLIYTFNIVKKVLDNPEIVDLGDGAEIDTATRIKTIEYSGSVISFTLNNCIDGQVSIYRSSLSTTWDTTNNTITFKATNAGTYTITLKIANTTNYIWDDNTTSNRVYTLTITKQPVDSVALYYLTTSPTDDGGTIESLSKITAQTDTRTYSPAGHLYRVTLADAGDATLLNSRIRVTAKASTTLSATVVAQAAGGFNIQFITCGTYTVTISLYSSNYKWAGTDSDTDAKTYTVTITQQMVSIPSIQDVENGYTKTVTYDTTEQSLVFTSKDVLFNSGIIKLSATTSTSGNTFAQSWSTDVDNNALYSFAGPIAAGTYTVTLTFVDTTNYCFTDGTSTQLYTLIIEKKIISAPSIAYGEGEDLSIYTAISKTVTYTGEPHFIMFDDYDAATMTLGQGALAIEENDDVSLKLIGTNVGTYTITFSPKSNYKWSDNTTEAKTFTLVINKKLLENPSVSLSNITSDGVCLGDLDTTYTEVLNAGNGSQNSFNVYVTYTGQPISIIVDNCALGSQLTLYNSSTTGFTYVSNDDGTTTLTATNVGNWYIRVIVKDDTYYDWAGNPGYGTNAYYSRYVYLHIQRKIIDVPEIVVDSLDDGATFNGSVKTVTYNGLPQYITVKGYNSNYMNLSRPNLTLSPTLNYLGDGVVDEGGGEEGIAALTEFDLSTYLSLFATDAATYTLTFSLKSTSNYIWSSGTTSAINSIQLVINPKKVAVPQIQPEYIGNTDASGNMATDGGVISDDGFTKTNVYDGSPIYMTLSPWSDTEVAFYEKSSTSIMFDESDAARFYAYDAGTHTVTLALKNTTNYVWADTNSNDNRTWTLTVTPKVIAIPEIVIDADADATYAINNSIRDYKYVTFNGGPRTISISALCGVVKIAGVSYRNITSTTTGSWSNPTTTTLFISDDSWNTVNNTLTMRATTVYQYRVYFQLVSGNYQWADSTSYSTYKFIYFTIKRCPVASPTIISDSTDGSSIVANKKYVQYMGPDSYLNFDISATYGMVKPTYSANLTYDASWNSENNTIHCSAINVGTYSVTFALADSNNYEWASSSDAKTLYLEITRKALEIPSIVGGGTNTTKTVQFQYDENGAGITQYMELSPIPSDTLIQVSGFTNISDETRLAYSYVSNSELGYGEYRCSATNVYVSNGEIASYYITLTLADANNYMWTDNTTGTRTYYLRIEPCRLTVPKLYEVVESTDGDGNKTTTDKQVDGNAIAFEYDANIHTFRLDNILSGFMSVTTNNNSEYGGNLTWSQDTEKNLVTLQASNVLFTNADFTTVTYYRVTLTLSNVSNYCWDNANLDTAAKTFDITVNRKKIAIPTIEGNENSTNQYFKYVPYSNTTQSFTLINVDFDWVGYTNGTLMTVSEQDGNKLYGVTTDDNVGYSNHYIQLNFIKDGVVNRNLCWTNNSANNLTYYIYIQTAYVPVPAIVNTNTQSYTGNDYVFQYSDLLDEGWMKYTLSDTAYMSAEAKDGVLNVTIAADAPIKTYSVVFVLVNNSNVRWVGYNTSYNYQNQTRYLVLQKAQLTIPNILDNGTSLKKTTTYNFAAQSLDIQNYLPDLLPSGSPRYMSYTVTSTAKFSDNGSYDTKEGLLKFSATNVGSYVVRISTNAFCTFSDNTTYKDYTLQIDKLVYDSPVFVDDGVGTTTNYVKTLTYNFSVQNATIKNVIEDYNKAEAESQIMRWYTVNSSGSAYTYTSEGFNISWDKETSSAKISAKNIGTYYITFKIADSMFANVRWSTTTSQAYTARVVINRAAVTLPTIVKTDLKTGESISGRYKTATYSGNNVVAEFKDFDDTYISYVDYTEYGNLPESYYAKVSYNAETKTLTITAQNAYQYNFYFRLKDRSNTQWAGVSSSYYTYDYYNYGITINKLSHVYPTVVSGVSTSVIYTGSEVEFKLQNVWRGSDSYTVTAGTLTEVSWTDDHILTLSAKDVGTYSVNVKIIDTNNTAWTYYTSRTFTFNITRKELTAEISFSSTNPDVNVELRNGSTSWASGMPVFVNADVTGLNQVEGETVGLNVYIYNNNNTSVTTTLTESGVRRYVIPTTLAKGTYYVVVAHSATLDNYTLGTYKQKFVIDSDPAGFTERDLVWQYSLGDSGKVAIGGNHTTAATAFELDYRAEAYSFSITLTDAQLASLNVRVVSYSGNITATNYNESAYCVTVKIAALNSNYYFPETSYSLYYKINKAKFDMSGVEWDYDAPLVYDGSIRNVYIKGDSLPDGLTVSGYTGDTNVINATEGTGTKYSTTVKFTIANENYLVPVQSDESSYIGTFSWSCRWEINKAEIGIEWKQIMRVDEDANIFYVPILATGDEMVNYAYEKWNDTDSIWESSANVTRADKEVKYRVTPTLKTGIQNYAQNYKLVQVSDEYPLVYEFTVGENQYPIVMHIELNGATGESFPYIGSPYEISIVVDQDEEELIEVISDSVQIKYLLGESVVQSAQAVGKYTVEISLQYHVKGQETTIPGYGSFEFEIVKGTLDVSNLEWKYLHDSGTGGVVYTYDMQQGKWVDQYGAEISEFTYDGNEHSLTLDGQTANSYITVKNITGTTATNAGMYIAQFEYEYDTANWNVPSFPNTLTWTVAKAKIDLSNASWSYTNPFTYAVGTEYTVELTNLSDSFNKMQQDGIFALSYSGNTASVAGTYTASFDITVNDSNYEVYKPEVLSRTLDWIISQRKLTIPEPGMNWTVFDNEVHDLIEVCKAEDGWSDYFTVTVMYSADGESFDSFGGYNDKQYDAYNAGFYKLTFAIISDLNDGNINVVWENTSSSNQSVTFTVDKLVLTVTGWNEDYENSTAVTDSGLSGDLLGYSLQRLDTGASLTAAQAAALGGGVRVAVTPYILENYASNATLAFTGDPEDEEYGRYTYTTEYVGLVRLDTPVLEEESIEYDGESHTFKVLNFDDQYLEFTADSDNLTQMNAGTYKVEIYIKSGSNASWNTSDGSIDDTTRITLEFTVTVKTIQLPEINNYVYTGSEIYVLNDLDAEFKSFVDVSGRQNATSVGDYTVILTLKDESNLIWSDNTTASHEITWKIEAKVLKTPDSGSWSVFDGVVHNLVSDSGINSDWSTYLTATVEAYDEDTQSFVEYGGYANDDPYSAYSAGIYRLTFTIKDGMNTSSISNVVWSSGETQEGSTVPVTTQQITFAVASYTVNVTGWNSNKENSTVKFASGVSVNDKFFEYTINRVVITTGENGEETRSETLVTDINSISTAGVGAMFVVRFAVKAEYAGNVEITYADTEYESLTFFTEKLKIAQPTIRFKEIEFDGKEHTFEIENWAEVSKYLEINTGVEGLKKTVAGNYSVVISFKANSVAEWQDGTSDAITLTFKITQKSITKPSVSNVEYTGKEIDVLSSYLQEYGEFIDTETISGNKATNVGTYTLKVSLKYPESTYWYNGTSEDYSISWKITPTTLKTPVYDGSWNTFDAQNHDLLSLCGVAENWQNYYTAKVEYSTDGETFNSFDGYSAYNYGIYKITYSIMSEHNPDGAENVVWDITGTDDVVINVSVSKLSVQVTGWNKNKTKSTVILADGATLPENIVAYRLTSNGATVSEETVLNAGYGEKFSIELDLKDTNGNVAVTYATGMERYTFVNKLMTLDKPHIENTSAVYNGSMITFNIADWDVYSNYVEILSGSDSLNQQDAGTYSVTLHIPDTMVFTWSDGSTDDFTLGYEITKVQVSGAWNTENNIPVFVLDGENYPTNLIVTSYVDESGATVTDDKLLVAGKNYTAKVAFASSFRVNYEFTGDTETEAAFVIPIVYTILEKPTLTAITAVYNGKEQTFAINQWSYYRDYLEITSGSLTVTDAGEYTVILHIKDGLNVKWRDDGTSDDVKLTFSITSAVISGEWTIENVGLVPVFVPSVEGIDELPADLFSYKISDSEGHDVATDEATKDGSYSITVSLIYIYSDNYKLADGVQTIYAYNIIDGELSEQTLEEIDIPAFKSSSLVYNGGEQTFEIRNWDSKYSQYLEIKVNSDSLSQSNVGKYSVILGFKSGALAKWLSGGKEDVTLSFEITALEISGSWSTSSGTVPVFVAEQENLPDDIFTYETKNAAGEVVTDIQFNVTYYITVSLAEDYDGNYKIISSETTYSYRINSDGEITQVIVKKLALPELESKSFEYNGEEQAISVIGWDEYKDFVTYTVKNESGAKTTLKYVGEYEIEFVITDATLATWANGSVAPYSVMVTITPRVDPPATHDVAELVTVTAEYSEKGQTFEIAEWDVYKDYVELIGDSLTQTEVGEYSITVRIKDTALFTWTDGNTDDVILVFEITTKIVRGEWNLSGTVPVFEPKDIMLEDLLSYEIKNFDGDSIRPENTVAGVTYYITASICSEYTEKYAFESVAAVAYSLRNTALSDEITFAYRLDEENNIVPVVVKLFDKPQIAENSVVYDGGEHTFVIYNWDEYAEYLQLSGDSLTQTSVNTYTVVVSFIDPSLASWSDGSYDAYELTFEITARTAPLLKLDKVVFETDKLEYTGKDLTFNIAEWYKYSDYVELIGDSLTQKNKAVYTVTAHIKDAALFTWTDGSVGDVTLTFEITERTAPLLTLDRPVFSAESVVYDGEEHIFAIQNWNIYKDYVELNGKLNATEVGKYTVSLHIIDTTLFTWSDGETDDIELTYAITEIVLSGSWNIAGRVPVLELENGEALPEDLLDYVITDASGNEVPAEETQSGVTYSIDVTINSEYESSYVFDSATVTTYKYRLDGDGTVTPLQIKRLTKPSLTFDSVVYDGTEHTFVIVDWDNYKEYLRIVGELTQKSVGEYSVVITIIDPTIASWTDGSVGDVTLTFEITERTAPLLMLDRPVFSAESVVYDGEEHIFAIQNWNIYKDYVELNGKLNATEVGKYTVSLHIIDTTLFTWSDGETDDIELTYAITEIVLSGSWNIAGRVPVLELENGEALPEDLLDYVITDASGNEVPAEETQSGVTYSIAVTINSEYESSYVFDSATVTTYKYRLDGDGTVTPLQIKRLTKPSLTFDSVVYDGTEHTFVIADWDKYKDYLKVVGELTQKSVGEHSVVITIIDPTVASWENGSTEAYTLTFNITDCEALKLNKPVFEQQSAEYTGEEITFAVFNWNIYKEYLTISGDELTQTEVGTYNVTLHINDTALFTWLDGTTGDITLSFSITESTVAYVQKVVKPRLEISSVTYDGRAYTFKFNDINTQLIEIVEGDSYLTQTEVGVYNVTLRLKNDNLSWTDGTTDDYKVTFTITKMVLGGTWGTSDSIPTPEFDTGNTFVVIPDGILNGVIKDSTGNTVEADTLSRGQIYTVAYTVSEKYADTFALSSSLQTAKFEIDSDGNVKLVSGAEEEDETFFGGFLGIAIAIGVILVVFLVALVVFLVFMIVQKNKAEKKPKEVSARNSSDNKK